MILYTLRILPTMILATGIASIYACEPAALNWHQLYQDYDQNKNKLIEKTEWQQLIQLKSQPYTLKKSTNQQDRYHFQIFKQLDTNHDGHLSEMELTGIYAYFPNPCEGWGETWAIGKQPESSWWKKLLNRFRAFW